MWNDIIKEFINYPRDLHTVPMTNREPKWFYVYVEDGKLYVESARNNMPKSNIKRTKMDEKKFEIMLEIYHKRLKGEQMTGEATANSGTSVYWYGIFAEMGL